MNASPETAHPTFWNRWRIARWATLAILLLIPLGMMQVVDGWNWTFGSFVAVGVVFTTIGLLYELAERLSASRAYRVGAGLVLVASLMMVWSTIVRDDGNGVGFFLILMTIGVGAFATSFRAAGLARTMLGVALMQALLGMLIATAPVTAAVPGEPERMLLYCGFFTALWLVAAGLFHTAARAEAS